MDKLERIVIVPSCTEQQTGTVDASFSNDVTGACFLLTCQVTEVLLQCTVFPLNNVWKIHIVLLVSGIHQWNVEAGETGNCSDVRAPSPIRSTVRCGSFYVMTSLSTWRWQRFPCQRRRSRSLHLPYCRLLHFGFGTKMWVLWTNGRCLMCAGNVSTHESKEQCFETYRGEIYMNKALQEVRIILK